MGVSRTVFEADSDFYVYHFRAYWSLPFGAPLGGAGIVEEHANKTSMHVEGCTRRDDIGCAGTRFHLRHTISPVWRKTPRDSRHYTVMHQWITVTRPPPLTLGAPPSWIVPLARRPAAASETDARVRCTLGGSRTPPASATGLELNVLRIP